MQNIMSFENNNNINLSIQLINDISIYAKRVTVTTLHTGGVIKASIVEIPGAIFRKELNWDSLESDYLEKIAKEVEQFGQKVDQAILTENGAIKRKEDFSQVKLLRKFINDWQPLELMTKRWINVLYDWFQYRIDQVSKSYLNQLIESIQFTEVGNEQQ